MKYEKKHVELEQEFRNYVNKAPEVKTTIHWWGLYQGHYVTLKKDFQKQFFQMAIERAGCFSWLGKKLNISRRTIAECFKCKTEPQILTLLKIAKLLDFSLLEIEKNILSISNLQPNFHLNLALLKVQK